MAKVIGAENQRMLQYNLRREDERKRDKDARTARQRANLAKSLTDMSVDPDIDDPNLAKLGMAVQADPDGFMGGIAQAFGTFAAMKGMDKKRDANRARRVDEVALNLDKIEGFDGGMDMLSQMDPSGEKRSDPRFLQGIANRLQEKQDGERRDAKYQRDLAYDAARAAEMGLRIDTAQQQLDERNKKQENWERVSPAVRRYYEELGLPENQIETLMVDQDSATAFYNQSVHRNLSRQQRGMQWEGNENLHSMPKEAYMNLAELPEPMAMSVLDKAIATPYIPTLQSYNHDLTRSIEERDAMIQQAREQAPDALFPVVDEAGNPTEASKAWLVSKAKILGYDYDEDDPLDEQYKEVLDQDVKANGVEVMATRMQQRQQELIAQDPNGAQAIAQFPMQIDGVMKLQQNINSTRENIMALRKKYKGLPVSTVPYITNDQEITTQEPGQVFRKPNGGFYVTLANSSMPAPRDLGFSFEGQPFSDASLSLEEAGMQNLSGVDTINAEVLVNRKIPFSSTPLQFSDRAKNAGYRELSDYEVQKLLPSLQGQIPVRNMSSMNEVDLSAVEEAESKLFEVEEGQKVKEAPKEVSQEITEEEIQAVLAKPSFARRLSPERRRQLAIGFLEDQKRKETLNSVQWYSK